MGSRLFGAVLVFSAANQSEDRLSFFSAFVISVVIGFIHNMGRQAGRDQERRRGL
jgi:hypothetical protein